MTFSVVAKAMFSFYTRVESAETDEEKREKKNRTRISKFGWENVRAKIQTVFVVVASHVIIVLDTL